MISHITKWWNRYYVVDIKCMFFLIKAFVKLSNVLNESESMMEAIRIWNFEEN